MFNKGVKPKERKCAHTCACMSVHACVKGYVGVLMGVQDVNDCQIEVTEPLSRHSHVYLDLVSVFFTLFQNIPFV